MRLSIILLLYFILFAPFLQELMENKAIQVIQAFLLDWRLFLVSVDYYKNDKVII